MRILKGKQTLIYILPGNLANTNSYNHAISSALSLNEACVRSLSEFWIVGRKSEGREFYLVLPKAEMTLLDVDGKFSSLFICLTSNDD